MAGITSTWSVAQLSALRWRYAWDNLDTLAKEVGHTREQCVQKAFHLGLKRSSGVMSADRKMASERYHRNRVERNERSKNRLYERLEEVEEKLNDICALSPAEIATYTREQSMLTRRLGLVESFSSAMPV